MASDDEEVMEQDADIEAALREVRVPEFVWEHSLRSLDHDMLADRLDNKEYGHGYTLILSGDFQIHNYDLLWYTTAKHLVLQDEEIEFLSMKDILAIASNGMQDSFADHIFIEGFVHAGRPFPLSPGSEHSVRQQIREWIMSDKCVYPYVQGNMASMEAWWGDDFTTYLASELHDYFVNQ